MWLRLGLCGSLLSSITGLAYGQETAVNSSVQAAMRSCGTVKMRLRLAEQIDKAHSTGSAQANASSDNLRAAGDSCEKLQEALASGDMAKAQEAASDILVRFPPRAPVSPREQLAKLEDAAVGQAGVKRFYALANLAKAAVDADELAKAQGYANELLQMAPQYPSDWNYGNAIYYGYFVLGRVALQQGNLALAEQDLLNAASTPGSPQLNSFGPNTTLAKELLEKGRTASVLQYFALCEKFWKMQSDRLQQWSAAVKAGQIPDFGANLRY